MRKSLNFKTNSKFLLNAISKAPDKKKVKVFKAKFAIYRKRMQKNAENFFSTAGQSEKFNFTIDTIERKIADHMKRGVYDQKELQRQINGIVSRSRGFQKQSKRLDVDKEKMKDDPDNARYAYIITHAVKTGKHSDECRDDLANQPKGGYTKEEMIEIIDRKPNHNNCTCHGRRIKNAPKQTERRFEQGNF